MVEKIRDSIDTCKSCCWSQPGEVDKNNVAAPRPLFCQRNPPVVVPMNGFTQQGQPVTALHTTFPQVTPATWCGEYDNGILDDEETEEIPGEHPVTLDG